MNKKYQIIISSSDPYPFNQINQNFSQFQTLVKVKLPVENKNWALYQKKITKILDLEKRCHSLIKINSISEDRTQQCFLLGYEYIEHGLDHFSQLKIQLSSVEHKVCQLSQFLLHQRIRPNYNINNFGFNKKHELKYFLLPNFVTLFDPNQLKNQTQNIIKNVKHMLKNLQSCILISPRETLDDDKISQRKSQRDLSAYNKKFQQKISSIENRLLLNRNGNGDKMNHQKIKRRKKFSQNFTDESISVSSSSENSCKVIESNQSQRKEPKYKKNSLNENYSYSFSKTQTEKFYTKSYNHSANNGKSSSSQKESPQSPGKQKQQKLTNSLIMEQKNDEQQRIKHHKSSFGDYSNYGNQSQKQTGLKRRITCALEKSQYALKIYEKYQSKRNNITINIKKV